MNYFIGNPSGVSIEEVIDLGNNEHFSKITCSIIPTIDYWKNLNNKILTDIICDKYDICFEYPVKSIKNAKASYTDVMLISDIANIAIESKWNEKIGVYCKNQKSGRKNDVQKHWIDIVSKYIGKNLMLQNFQDIEYQLLHRVASACSLQKDNCIVVYQIFYLNDYIDTFKDEIIKIKNVLGSSKIKFYLDLNKLVYTNSFINLVSKLKKVYKKEEKIELIKNTLKKYQLFKFDPESLKQI